MLKKLSIIVPVYKVEAYLEQCVKSLLDQTYENIEIILVDDGSPDLCPKLCDDFARVDLRVKVIHKENGGLSDARNTGIKAATGDYITFVDSDDYIRENSSYAKAMAYLKENPEVQFVTSPFLYEHNGRVNENAKYVIPVDLGKCDKIEAYKIMIEKGCFLVSACTKILNRDFVVKNNLFFEKGIVSEDTEWIFRVMRVVEKVGSINYAYYIYRQDREGSITNSGNYVRSINAMLYIIKNSLNFWKEDLNNDVAQMELSYCAYLWIVCLAQSRFEKTNKRLWEEVSHLSCILEFDSYKQTKLIKRFYKIFRSKITSIFLHKYLLNRNKRNTN